MAKAKKTVTSDQNLAAGNSSSPIEDRAVVSSQKKQADYPDPCVYCGPSVRHLVRQYTTYRGGIPQALSAFVASHPAAGRLIVSTDNFPQTRKKLETPGTAEYIIYQQILKSLS